MNANDLIKARERLELWRNTPLTWDPVKGGKHPLVCWDDEKTYELGSDPEGTRFTAIRNRMMTGHYYPPDVLEFFGDWIEEQRELRPGDRVLQRARLFGPFPNPCLWAMTEIFVAEADVDTCSIGYVTTKHHFGRGIWRATLTRPEGRLSLTVRSTAGPGSFWFWIGLPIGRALMLRARRRAVEAFRSL